MVEEKVAEEDEKREGDDNDDNDGRFDNLISFEIGLDGKVIAKLINPDGTIYYSDATSLPSGIYLPADVTRWNNVVKELQELINDPNVKEYQIQAFIDRYPDLITEDKFDIVIPQALLQPENTSYLRPDYVIVPLDQNNFSKVIELKLPQAQLFSLRGKNKNYSQTFIDAIQQLRIYAKAFSSPTTINNFKNKYGRLPLRPVFKLIIGRKTEYVRYLNFVSTQLEQNLYITNWDDFINHVRDKMT